MPATILVIDDDPSIVNLLKESLEGEGYRVLQGYDGRAAMEIATNSRPQLIIMDMNMPGMDGAGALNILRQSPATASIPVIFLTGDDANHLPPELAESPRVSHLVKPIALDQLNSVVQRFLVQYPVR